MVTKWMRKKKCHEGKVNVEFYRYREFQKRQELKLAFHNKNKTIYRTEYKQTPEVLRNYRTKRTEI